MRTTSTAMYVLKWMSARYGCVSLQGKDSESGIEEDYLQLYT